MMDCVCCSDGSCDECDQRGRIRITKCPLEYITPATLELIKYAKLYKKGLPPILVGSLDLTRWFTSAADFIFSELDYWDRKTRLF